jgi:hypothetical protein
MNQESILESVVVGDRPQTLIARIINIHAFRVIAQNGGRARERAARGKHSRPNKLIGECLTMVYSERGGVVIDELS